MLEKLEDLDIANVVFPFDTENVAKAALVK